MSSFLIFALNRFIFRISEFIRHWYVGVFVILSHFVVSRLEKMDRLFATKITLRHIFDPLYQDESILGYILGPIFRFFRLFSGYLVYLIIILIALIIYLAWTLIPIFLIFKIMQYKLTIDILGMTLNI